MAYLHLDGIVLDVDNSCLGGEVASTTEGKWQWRNRKLQVEKRDQVKMVKWIGEL